MSQLPPQSPYGDSNTFGAESGQIWGMSPNTFNMLMHLSQLLNFALPAAGLIVPIVMWATQKDQHPSVDEHGKVIINWMISALIYGAISFVLTFLLVGFIGFILLFVLGIIFPILGAVKANNGELWPYPLTIRFLG